MQASNTITRILILLIVGAFLVGVVLVALQKKVQPLTTQQKATSQEAPVQITTARGMLIAITGTSLSIKTQNTPQAFSFAKTVDVQRIVSGTLEKGDVKTVKAKMSDVKVGQEVLIVVQKETSMLNAILIIK